MKILSAFPWITDDGERIQGEKGMTLRDYFAAKAMQSYTSDKEFVDACAFMEKDVKEEIARVAYAQADAMLKAREK
jgi:hypothetical protein